MLAYWAARRARDGFRNLKPSTRKPSELETEAKYEAELADYEAKYEPLVRKLKQENAGFAADEIERLENIQKVKSALSKTTNKEERASMKWELKWNGWRKPKYHDIPSRENYIISFGTLSSFVASQHAAVRTWGNHYTKPEYKDLVLARSSTTVGKPRTNLYAAYARARAFHLVCKEDAQRLEALCARKGVKKSRAGSLTTTRIAKLLVGETVTKPSKTSHSGYREVWCFDRNLVNKVANMLALLDRENVAPADMTAWIKRSGGVQACISRHRKSRRSDT